MTEPPKNFEQIASESVNQISRTPCEACAAGYRRAADGLHYDDEHGGATWGVCRGVVAGLQILRQVWNARGAADLHAVQDRLTRWTGASDTPRLKRHMADAIKEQDRVQR